MNVSPIRRRILDLFRIEASFKGSLVSRVAVTNTYKEIAHLSKSLHFSSRCLPGILSGYVSFYHELARLDE